MQLERKLPSDIQLPPGFRFHPSDEELIVHYLRKKVTSNPLPASIMADIDLYKYNPWDLPKKALFGDDEWYFFTPRNRKYPNGARPNRAAASGYWKATGTDTPILTSCGTKSTGVKKALVFYNGRSPKGYKTDWTMHEYRLLDSTIIWTPKKKGSMRLDDWVLCRVRHKSSKPNPRNDEAAGFLPKPTTNPNIEMTKSFLYKDCPMLPYIFASQDFRCMDTASSTSFSLKRKFNTERTRRENDVPVPPSKKTAAEEIVISVSNEYHDGTDHSERNNLGHDDQWSVMQYQLGLHRSRVSTE